MNKTTGGILIALTSLLALGGLAGISVALARNANQAGNAQESSQKATQSSTVAPTSAQSQSEYQTQTPSTSSQSASGSPSTSSSVSLNPQLEDTPYIFADRSVINLSVQTGASQMPRSSFTATLTCDTWSDEDAYYDKDLVICCPSDDTMVDWLEFRTTINGAETIANSGKQAYIRSGVPVFVTLKKEPPIVGGYHLKLRIYSPRYDSSTVKWFIDVNLQTTQ